MIASSSRIAVRQTSRVVQRRTLATEPKLHRAKDKWSELEKVRAPKDHGDEHLVFHPPFNGPVVGVALFAAFATGYGLMGYGAMHQQKKQGYWKK